MLKSKNGILTGNTTANTVAWTAKDLSRTVPVKIARHRSYLVPLRTNTAPVFRMTDFRESARVCSAYAGVRYARVCAAVSLWTGHFKHGSHLC